MGAARRKIGGDEVFPIGFGCMNLSHAYGPMTDREGAQALLRHALDLGCTFLDTATIYGFGRNETLIGETLKGRRNEFVLASKCVMGFDGDRRVLDGSPSAIKAACDASLERLQTDVIDLYYMHRPDPAVPIEESVGALAKLVAAGKIRMIGLSEMSADMLRRAHAVHPIAAMQSEYSLMTRNPEIAVLDACAELGTTFVAFSPVGRGFFSETALNPDNFHEKDLRRTFPRFREPNYAQNLGLLTEAKVCAEEAGCTVAQLALAWTLAQGDHVVPIPGTTKLDHLEEDLAAAEVQLTEVILERLDRVFAPDAIAGPRYGKTAQASVTTEQFDFEIARAD